MDKTEMESLVKQLKAAGLNEEQIMETFFETFQEGKMDRKDLEACAEFMGYELTDEFKNDETPDPIAVGGKEGISKEAAEEAKEIEPGESKEEFKEKLDNPDEETEDEVDVDEKEDEEVDEDKEWEEVQKKFKW